MANVNTSLSGEFSICQSADCNTSWSITDESGVYSPDNTTGWGGGVNPELTDVDTATLTVISTTNTQTVYDLLTLSGGTFPNTDDIAFDLTPPSSTTVDGVYEMTYYLQGDTITVAGSETSVLWSVSKTKLILLTCNVDCCLNKLFGTISASDCMGCQEDTLLKIIKAKTYLDGAKAAACCGDKDKATRLLAMATYLCSAENCKSC